MTAPVPTSQHTLPESLLNKLIAVRLQREAFDREIVVAQLSARNAALERENLERNLPPLIDQARDALKAPANAQFNWQTFTFDSAPATEAPDAGPVHRPDAAVRPGG